MAHGQPGNSLPTQHLRKAATTVLLQLQHLMVSAAEEVIPFYQAGRCPLRFGLTDQAVLLQNANSRLCSLQCILHTLTATDLPAVSLYAATTWPNVPQPSMSSTM
eukprot:GHRR01020823.1.p1 GENE.GHRR01020823.1~~GHRR01020823.1.p1  ORF type:complete len:105 (-),score=23.81 GHRR01020823.1:52-366(-)